MISPADVAKTIEAADTLGTKLSTAEAAGWSIIDRLDPDVRAQLLARIDADES